MTSKEQISLSRFLSKVLRHYPGAADVTLSPEGWVRIDALITGAARKGRVFDRNAVELVVETNDKKRFVISPDGQSIRAAQGHSIDVELGMVAQEPPAILFHGTATKTLRSILREGLRPRKRQYVHLSKDIVTATKVGSRHGDPVVLNVEAGRAFADGQKFYLSENRIWLTDALGPEYLAVIGDGA